MKNQLIRRLLACMLTIVIAASMLGTQAFAATTTVSNVAPKDGNNGEIVVTVYDQTPAAGIGTGAQWSGGTAANLLDGVGINALRIGSVVELTTSTVEDSTTTTRTQVAFGLTEDMAQLVGLDPDANANYIVEDNGIYYYAPTVVQNALSTKNNQAGGQAAIEAALNANKTQTHVTGENTGDEDKGIATFSDLTYGLYLLAKSALPAESTTDLTPFLVSVPMYVETESEGAGKTGTWNSTVYAYPKVRTDTIEPEKTAGTPANDGYVNAGDTIPFTISVPIPATETGTGSPKPFATFVITDTNDGKTLKVDTASIVVKHQVGTALPDNMTLDTDYTVVYDTTGVNAVLTITLTEAGLTKLNAGLTEAQNITVTYNATVSTDVVFDTSITNGAKVDYDRGSGVVTSEEDEVTLYTYGIALTKTLSDDAPITANTISFALYKKYEGGQVSEKIPVVSGIGGYWVAAAEATPDPVVMYVNTDGQLNLYGLEPGTYYLKELTTQTGYTLLAEPIEIVITAPATPGEPATITVNGKNAQVTDGVASLQVENTKNEDGFNLPQTGGAGTLLVTAIGLGLLCAGVVLLVAYRKKTQS